MYYVEGVFWTALGGGKAISARKHTRWFKNLPLFQVTKLPLCRTTFQLKFSIFRICNYVKESERANASFLVHVFHYTWLKKLFSRGEKYLNILSLVLSLGWLGLSAAESSKCILPDDSGEFHIYSFVEEVAFHLIFKGYFNCFGFNLIIEIHWKSEELSKTHQWVSFLLLIHSVKPTTTLSHLSLIHSRRVKFSILFISIIFLLNYSSRFSRWNRIRQQTMHKMCWLLLRKNQQCNFYNFLFKFHIVSKKIIQNILSNP